MRLIFRSHIIRKSQKLGVNSFNNIKKQASNDRKQHIIAHIITHAWNPLLIGVSAKNVRCAIINHKILCGDFL